MAKISAQNYRQVQDASQSIVIPLIFTIQLELIFATFRVNLDVTQQFSQP